MAVKLETLPGGTPVFAGKAYPVTTDSLLLGDFCPVHAKWSACDLGAGAGLLLLRLVDRGLRGPAVGVEVREGGARLLEKAAALAQLPNVKALCADVRTFKSGHAFDLVVCNPPYFSAGKPPPSAARATARHDGTCTIEDVCAAAARLLKDGGSLCVCWPPVRLAALFAAAQKHGLAPKRMQLVRKGPGDAPWLALVDARRAGGEGLSILPDVILPPGQAVHY